jgi:hypothetical protein
VGAQIGITRSRALLLSAIPVLITLVVLWWLITSGKWNLFGIWTLDSTIGWSTGFGDLAFITATADCFSQGVSDLNTCDPYGRPYTPYGLIPGTVLSWFGLGLSHTGILGSLLALTWVVLVFWLTFRVTHNWTNGNLQLFSAVAAITLFAISPTVLLAVERGTLDILVAALAALGLIGFTSTNALKQSASAIALFFSVVIKYFAVGVFAPFFAPRKWSVIATLGATATVLFMIFNLENLRVAQQVAQADSLSTTRIMFSSTTGLVTMLVQDPLAFNPPAEQVLNSTTLAVISAALFVIIVIALTLLLRKSQHKRITGHSSTGNSHTNSAPHESWLLIVGGTFALTIPYFLGASNDYRLVVLLLPLAGLLIWIRNSPGKILEITLWILVGATTFSALTGAAMIPNESGFILPKLIIVVGDAALATILAFGVALFINAWLPKKKVSE